MKARDICKKNILITGANGFIGKAIQKRLLTAQYNIIEHDIENGDISSIILNYPNINHVFHLAALTYVPKSWENTFDYYKTNVMGTINVLELCRKTDASLTFMSTYVYGVPEQILINENHTIAPNSPYNHSKVLGENSCEFYNKTFSTNITVLRPFNIYGYGQSRDFLIPTIIEQFLDKNVNTVTVMDFEAKRDYLYIDDLIDVMTKTIENKGFNIYNVGSGTSKSVLEIILIVKQILKSSKPFESKHIVRKNEVSNMIADITKIQQELKWNPRFTIEDGLKKMIDEMMWYATTR